MPDKIVMGAQDCVLWARQRLREVARQASPSRRPPAEVHEVVGPLVDAVHYLVDAVEALQDQLERAKAER